MFKVIKEFPGSPDGMHVKKYLEGESFEEMGELLKVAINEGWVEEVPNLTQSASEDSLEEPSENPIAQPQPMRKNAKSK